jgi:hypothetical protein
VPQPSPEELAHYNSMHQKYSRDGSSYYGPVKEQYPMLHKDHPATIRESDYTTTLHRRLAVPPPPAMNNGVFPDLPVIPPPPQSAGPMGELCPVHGAYGDGCMTSMHSFRPPAVEHIYESPKFDRKRRPKDSPFYHELEPTSNSDPSESGDSQLDLSPPDPTQLPRGLQGK